MNRTGLDMIEADSLEQVKGACVYQLVAEEYREAFKELVRGVFRGETRSLEFKMIGLKGRPLWLYTHAAPIRDEKGDVVLALSTTIDITDRKLVEQALRESESQLARAQKIAHLGHWEWDIAANKLIWSEEVFRIYGLDPAKDVPTYEIVVNTIPEGLRPEFLSAIDNALKNNAPFEGEYQVVRPDGSVRDTFTTGELVRDENGNLVKMFGIVLDITERKKTEEALRDSEEKFRTLADESPNMIFINKMGGIVYVNKRCQEIMGYSADEFLSGGFDFLRLVSPESLETVRRSFAAHRAGRDVPPYEYSLLRKDGLRLDVILTTKLIDFEGDKAILGIVTDITERKRAEESVRESEERYRRLVDASPIPIMVHTDWKIVYINPSAEKAFGASRTTELIGKDALSVVHPDMRKFAEKRISGIYSGKQAAPPNEARFLRLDGTEFDVIVSGVPIKFMDRPAAQVMFQDITEMKRVETALRRSEERYRTIFDKSVISLWEEDFSVFGEFIADKKAEGVSDIPGYLRAHPEEAVRIAEGVRVLDVNEATLRLYGAKTKEEFFGSLQKVFAPESYGVFLNGLIALAEGKTYFSSEALNRTLQGRPLSILISWSIPPGYEKTLSRAFVSVVDVTDRKLLEEERLKAHKLESVGMLAGGIAHDFNNLLTGVFGNVSLAKLHMNSPEKAMEFLSASERAMKQAKGLTSQLLTFSKGGLPIKKRVPVGGFFRDAVAFALSGTATGCSFDIRAEGWFAEADEVQMTQAVQNIVTNAREAMAGGGKIAARAYVITNDGELHNLAPGQYAVLEIEDAGSGIPHDVLARIFDPYFTTKETGTGLGLAVAYSIVEKHGGAIAVKSEEGEGSVFRIYIPAFME